MREFYYNDAGVQIATLAASVKARLDGLKPGDPGWPESAYNGDYIADIAADFAAGKTVRADDREFTASGRSDDLDGIRQFAVAYLRHEQDLDLQAFGVRFDNYYLESSLYASGRVEATVARLVAAGKTYEEGGALWLRTTDYGDDKDRVMRKSDGSYTYFVPDVAYHLAKFERGFTTGDQHPGHRPPRHDRARACRPAGGRRRRPAALSRSTCSTRWCAVERGGEEVKISKRAGNYVTLRDLIDWTSRDAVRFFMLSSKADTEFTFDVDLALKQNDENPVFYVQYAHARICSVLEQYAAQGGDAGDLADADLALPRRAERDRAAEEARRLPGRCWRPRPPRLAPHEVAFYLRDLAAAFHSYYAAERFLVDDPRAGARAPGPARGDAPGHPQRARRPRRRRAGAHDRERRTRHEGIPRLAPPSAAAS